MRFGLVAVLVVALTSCGTGSEPICSRVANSRQGLSTENGLSTNGLSTNGLSTNGLSTNGLDGDVLRGTKPTVLDRRSPFAKWFAADPEGNGTLMKYVVRCAAASDGVVTFTDESTGVGYRWEGLLDLAPGWVAGEAATEYEQQIVSACLAAHVNKYGAHVEVSMQGISGNGHSIPLAEDELVTFSTPEGCFFGNVFSTEGAYVGLDHPAYGPEVASLRACALGNGSACAPLVGIGQCGDHCTRAAAGTSYDTCTANGVTYPAITTRLRDDAITVCGQ